MTTLSTPISTGRTAEIYAWGEGRVLKLIRPEFPAQLADQEWTNALAAWQSGAPVPKPFELIEVDGRRGVIFERLVGSNLLQVTLRNPLRLLSSARLLARQQALLHAIPAPAFPSMRTRLESSIAANAADKPAIQERLLALLASLPDGDRMCHADFHPENVILTPRGPLVIDWEGCMRGCPSADVAVTRLWIRSALTFRAGPGGWMLRQVGQAFERAYLEAYNAAAPAPAADQVAWIAIVTTARAHEHDPKTLPHLVRLITPVLESHGSSSKK